MENNDNLELINGYDYFKLKQLSTSEWRFLTNDFELRSVEQLLIKLSELFKNSSNDTIIQRQLEIFEQLEKSYNSMRVDVFGHSINTSEAFENGAYYKLHIRAGKYLNKKKVEIPIKEDKTPKYEAIQQVFTDYVSACKQIKKILSQLDNSAIDNAKLLDTLKEKEEEIANLKRELDNHKNDKKTIEDANLTIVGLKSKCRELESALNSERCNVVNVDDAKSATQKSSSDNDDLFHLIHPAIVDEDEQIKIQREVQNLVKNNTVKVICNHLRSLEKAGKILLPKEPKSAFDELQRMGMPEESTRGFSYKNFNKYY